MTLIDLVKGGSLNDIIRLIGTEIDLNERDNNDWTPLHHAAANGHLEIVKVLIKAGANIEAKSIYRVTPLHAACSVLNNEAVIEVLLKARANIEAKTSSGATPLHIAAAYRCRKNIKMLLLHGANAKAKNNDGLIPAQLVSSRRIKELLSTQ